MPTISITDTTSAEVDVDLPSLPSGFLKNPKSVLHFVENDVIHAFDQPIDQAKLSNLTLGFNYNPSFTLGNDDQLSIGGSLKSNFSICRAPKDVDPDNPPVLFEIDPFDDEPISLADACYTQMGCIASASVGNTVEASAYVALSAGADLSASASMYLPYAKSAGYPTLKEALVSALSNFSIPTSRADLANLPLGHIFTFEATGDLTASGSFDLLTLVNPTVAAGLAGSYGPLDLSLGPEVSLGGSVTLSSDFQIRIRKVAPNLVRIGHYREKGSTLSVTFDALVEADATVKGQDLVGPFFDLLGSNTKIDKQWFQQNGAVDLADQISETLKAAVQKKLSIALDAESDASVSSSTAFLFDFDLSKLDAKGQAALDALLHGNLSTLVMAGPLPPGITKRANIIERIHSTTHALTVNFLGILSYADIASFALDSVTKFTENGEVVMADQATASEIAVAGSSVIPSQKLHQVMASLFAATISYNCTLADSMPTLAATKQFYEFQKSIDQDTLTWFFDVAGQLGLSDHVPAGPYKANGWINAVLTYDQDAAKSLFLDGSGHALPALYFVGKGRDAMVAAVRANPLLDYLKYIQQGQPYWDRIVDQDKGGPWPMNDQQKRLFGMVCFAVNGWASAMAGVSKLLEQMIAYTKAHTGPDLAHDAAFLKLRSQLASHLKDASAKLEGDWVPSWSLFAIYLSHAPTSGNVDIGFRKQAFSKAIA